jgi:hypothetical protein
MHEHPPLRRLTRGETYWTEELLLLARGLLAGDSGFFLLGSGAGFSLFLTGFLLCGFWGSIAHNFDFDLVICMTAAYKFLRCHRHHA